MEPMTVRSEGRGRKRRRKDVKKGSSDHPPVPQPKKRAVDIRGKALVGRYVLKEFDGDGVFLGKVVFYDSGLYRVDYEDGDCEDLDSVEIRQLLIEDAFFDDELIERRKKLDGSLPRNEGNLGSQLDTSDEIAVKNTNEQVEVPMVNEVSIENGLPSTELDGIEVDDDTDSSNDFCEYPQDSDMGSGSEVPAIPPPLELPPSSGTIAVPEEFVPSLFSVYGFLRSFSIRLFLSPFTLNDLVGCLNCTVPNTLLNAIHVALLREVRRRLETLSSDGSELASKCLRCIDWKLLDILTWPVYLANYLLVMGYLNGDFWGGFLIDALEKNYCTLSVERKLMVLQILCDDALDSAEIRAEVDFREQSEIGEDSEGIMAVLPETGPRKLHPLSSKTSDGNDRINAADYVDGNGDECRLCGMDGTLLCCDGCPSAYHSRCIGVSKGSIPEGTWYCPECTISKVEPPLTVGTSLRGAEIFGIDLYDQLFLGTCNHLVVLKGSVSLVPIVRYYNSDDIPSVLSTVTSSTQHAVLYSGICRAILKYWQMPEHMILLSERVQAGVGLENIKEGFCLPTASHPFCEGGSVEAFDPAEVEKYVNESGSLLENMTGLAKNNSYKQPGFGKVSLDEAKQMELAIVSGSSDAAVKENGQYTVAGVIEHVKTDNTMLSASAGQRAHLSDSTQLGMAERSCVTVSGTCTSQYKTSTGAGGPLSGAIFPASISGVINEGNNGVVRVGSQKSRDSCLYMGSMFKPQAYINYYVQGDFAASAAANLAILTSEEQRASDVHLSDPRKVMSVNVSLQAKAFSSAATRFFWPNTEKKLIEVPRERCGWCLSCKAPATSKKACLLNAAALNATRAAMKSILGIRLAKNIDGSLYSIAVYMLYMEESLRGLIVGPFHDATYRLQWRKRVEKASTCNEMKLLLLELEENLRSIALSGDWFNLVNNWMDESSAVQSTCLVGSIQKRGPGRRGRKPLNASEIFAYDSCDRLKGFIWWREGKSSKLLFQKRTLPHGVLRKAARQGGSRRISGIYYGEGSDLPKRSRQVIWRAAVDLSKNSARLALQVRYLDAHIKWSEVVRPDQVIQDGKGAETDVSFFRNASIRDKKVVENKVMYAVAFGCQKHLSSRIMKSIIEKEETADGNDKLWFSEIRIPLYLIKEYEEKADKPVVVPAERPSEKLSKLQIMQLRASRKQIFNYLGRKRENMMKCSCASCHLDVLIDSAVRCNACEGYCHKCCIVSRTVQTDVRTCNNCLSGKALTQKINKVESPTSPLTLQGQEYHGGLSSAKSFMQKASQDQESQSAPPTSRSAKLKALQGKEYQSTVPASKSAKKKTSNKRLPSALPMEGRSERKVDGLDFRLAAKSQKRLCNWGLIWRKKNVEETGPEFRRKHLILKNNPNNFDVSELVCNLCQKGYDSHFMFIQCLTCSAWYHSDALELDESKLPDLQGFKCCKCRRIRSPVCPYTDPERLKASEAKKPRVKTLKRGKIEADSVHASVSDQTESSIPTTPISFVEEDVSLLEEDVFVQVNDPLLLSASNVEPIPEPKAEADYEWSNPSGPLPHKLPVRRHLKNEDNDGFTGNYYSPTEFPPDFKSNSLSYPMDNMSSPHVEWDVSTCGLGDGISYEYEGFNYLDTEYEPQTYFSYTELLATDDAQLDGIDVSGDIPGTLQNWTCANSQSGVLEQSEMGFVGDQLEPMAYAETAAAVPCSKCSQTDPIPDLCCQDCGLHIHNHCSPWEELPQEECWRCGNCRL